MIVPTEAIKNLELERDQELMRAEAMQSIWEGADRSPTDDEQSAFDAKMLRIDQIDQQIANQEKLIRAAERRAVVVEPETEVPVPAGSAARTGLNRPPGILFAQIACGLGLHRGNASQAIHWARDKFKDDALLHWALDNGPEMLARTAVATGDTVADGYAEQIAGFRREASEFIELLRAESIMLRIPMRELQFGTVRNYELPRQSGGIGGNWVGEDKAIPADALSFDNIPLFPFKASSIVVITRELAQYSEPSAMALVRDDMVEGLSRFIDTKFVSDDAASTTISPAGVFAGGGTVTAAAAGTPVERITADLLGLVNDLDTANIPSNARTLIMNTQERNYLMATLDSLGNYPYRNEVGGGSIWGMNIVASNTMTATNVGLIEASQVIRGVAPSPLVDVSGDATIHLDDSPADDIGGASDPTPIVSFYQRDLLGTRTIFETSWVKRHDAAVSLAASVDWSPVTLP